MNGCIEARDIGSTYSWNSGDEGSNMVRKCGNTDNTILQVHTFSWSNDSHGLFDYESKNIQKRTFKIQCEQNSYTIVRLDDELQVIPSDLVPLVIQQWPSVRLVLELRRQNDHFIVIPSTIRSEIVGGAVYNTDSIWILVRSVKGKSTKLQQGDIARFGRFRLRIKEIGENRTSQRATTSEHDEKETMTPDPDHQFPLRIDCDEMTSVGMGGGLVDNCMINDFQECNGPIDMTPNPFLDDKHDFNGPPIQSPSSSTLCRICLSESDTKDDPLIVPCNCRGSMKYVHLGCLRRWIVGRMDSNNECHSVSYFWQSLDCELCNGPYPTYITANQKIVELSEIPKPKEPYIVLEPISNSPKGLHIVTLGKRSYAKIGRGHDTDIRLNDISVSRNHAVIRYQNGSFRLEDHNSKFGTLTQVRGCYVVHKGQSPISFQTNQLVITISAKTNKKCGFGCFGNYPILDEDITLVEGSHKNQVPTLVERLDVSSRPRKQNKQPNRPENQMRQT